MAKSRVHPQLARLRKYAKMFPESTEVEAWGHPTFRAGKKIFASFGEYEGGASIGVKQTKAEQARLVQDPRIKVAAYVGKHGWISIDADAVPWDEIEPLVERSYRLVALKRMVRALDERWAP